MLAATLVFLGLRGAERHRDQRKPCLAAALPAGAAQAAVRPLQGAVHCAHTLIRQERAGKSPQVLRRAGQEAGAPRTSAGLYPDLEEWSVETAGVDARGLSQVHGTRTHKVQCHDTATFQISVWFGSWLLDL